MSSSRVLLILALRVSAFAILRQSMAAPVSVDVVGGGDIQRHSGTIQIPRSAKAVVFRVGDAKQMRRVRYMLEGVDSQWIHRPGDMCLCVQFYNKTGDLTDQERYIVKGESSGWRTTVADSAFIHRRETLIVPPAAESISLVYSSAGAPTAIGVYVFEDVIVSRPSNTEASPEVILESSAFLRSANEDAPGQIWKRDGMHPSMAHTIILGDRDPGRKAFCITDDDRSAHAEWRTVKTDASKVSPGEQLTIDWNELYNIGEANRFDIAYPTLLPGKYVFKVQEVDTIGTPLGPEQLLNLSVTLPFWETRWFLISCICLAAVSAAAGTYYLARARIRRRFDRMRQQQMVERERLRIARDIHDDIGARLTHISLVSSLAATDELPDYAAANFNKIGGMARDLVAALYETIWTVNPENDRLDSLVPFLCQTIHNLCGAAGISCRLDTVRIDENRPVTSEIRHNVILVTKEAIHNAIKHSEATEVHVQIRFESSILSILIQDNGKGFSKEAKDTHATEHGGHGMKNMHVRMQSLKGTINVESSPGEGTNISLKFPIP